MPRASRYLQEGYTYHLTHRCHDRRFLLRFKRERKAYREWLRVGAKRYGVPVYGYCLGAANPRPLEGLHRIAPVVAIRGNVDHEPWSQALPMTEVAQVGSRLVYVLHDLAALDLDPVAAGFHAVVSGHSHDPYMRTEAGVLYLNPGSAGPRRFKLPVALAILTVEGDSLQARHVIIG